MKRIIDRKLYDTATATEIAEWSNAGLVPRDDFKWCEEHLYRTPSGAYFLAGEGGAMSPWAEALPNGTRGWGVGIRALDPGEALDWAEARGIDPDLVVGELPVQEA